jgi:hypothetical protein
MASRNTHPQDRIVWRSEICKLAGGVTSETVRRWMKSGKLPPPDVALSLKTKGWKLSTLHTAGIGLI